MGRVLHSTLVLIALSGGLSGCGKQAATGTGLASEPVAVNLDRAAPAAASSSGGSSRGSELADLIQRDIDEFNRRRQNGGDLTSNRTVMPSGSQPPDPDELDDSAARLPLDERPFWEQPGRLDRLPPPEQSAATTERRTEFANNPLFRDPDSFEVRPFGPVEPDDEAIPAEPPLTGRTLDELLTSLRAELYQDASRSDMPLRELLMIAAMSMIDPDRAIEPDAVPDLTDDERELLAKLQAFFAGLGAELDGSRASEEVVEEAVAGLRQNLLNLPQFEILNAAYCWRVEMFGDYEEVPRYAFLAHSKQQVILYVEIDGFTSERNVEGDWETKISQKLTILTQADGVPVWQDDWRTSIDQSREQRRDFYTTQILTLPEALSVGSYVMKVRLRDEVNGAESEKSIPFTLVADPRMAASLK